MLKKKNFNISTLSIVILFTSFIVLLTIFMPQAEFKNNIIVSGSGVITPSLYESLMAPVDGFLSSAELCLFIIVFGGLLGIFNKTGTLELGIRKFVNLLKNKELYLIPIFMFGLSICSATYGMFSESIIFYIFVALIMLSIGMDTLVSSSIVLLGIGSGLLGSITNPYITEKAISLLPEGIEVNRGIMMSIGVFLWIVALGISVFFVVRYAKKIRDKKGSILTKREETFMNESFSIFDIKDKKRRLTKRQSISAWVFTLGMVVMIIGFFPWVKFGVISESVAVSNTHWSSLLTGACFGTWGFGEASLWMGVLAIIIGIINKINEADFVDAFSRGVKSFVPTIIVISVVSGALLLLKSTHIDDYIFANCLNLLKDCTSIIFLPLNYFLHFVLAIFIPNGAELASTTLPSLYNVAIANGSNIETTIMTFEAGSGVAYMLVPTCLTMMAGLSLNCIDYKTWIKWSTKVIVGIIVSSLIILLLAEVLF